MILLALAKSYNEFKLGPIYSLCCSYVQTKKLSFSDFFSYIFLIV